VAGLFLSQRASEIFNHQTRLQAYFVWEAVIFLLNGVIFILIGLQLHIIAREMHDISLVTLVGYGALISITAIVLRIIWVYPGTYLPRWFSKRIRTTEVRPDPKMVGVVAWSGMRGVVSLAAAFQPSFVTNPVEQNAPHRFGGSAKKMSAAVPGLFALARADQPQVRLVDQCRGLQRLARSFLGEALGGKLAQLFIHQR
jgi:NhaP-type Na+/H+ or K+/H+ antiporter